MDKIVLKSTLERLVGYIKAAISGKADASELKDVKKQVENKADLVDGKVPLAQLGNIDTQVMLVVDKLPNTDIKANKIYLVKNTDSTEDQNVYTEYVYVNWKWEKLGEFKAEVDLSGYAEKSSSIKKIYRLTEGQSRTFTRIEGNNFVEALTKEGNFVGVVINIKIPNSEEQWCVANNSNGVPFIIANESPTNIKVSIGNDEYFIINNYNYWTIDGEKYIRAFWMPKCFVNNSSSDKIVYGLLSNNNEGVVERWYDVSKISSKTTINDVKFVDVTDYDNFSSDLKQPIGTLIASRSKNNIAIEYADGHIERFNKTDDIRIGGYAENYMYNSFQNFRFYSYFTKDASLEVNGSLKCRDFTTRGKAEINGTLTVYGQAEIDGTIKNNDNPLKVGETTINGTLHVENHDIKSKSIYPANTGSSSLKDPSKGKVPGNYVVTKSNLGKGAHNYDKIFVENIYWSDCTDINRPSTNLNNEGTIQILNARGINKKPVWIFDGSVDKNYNDGYDCDFLGIYATNYSNEGYSIADTIIFNYSQDSGGEAPYRGRIAFNVNGCTISDGVGELPFIFGNGVHYDKDNKIPFDFVDLPNIVIANNKNINGLFDANIKRINTNGSNSVFIGFNNNSNLTAGGSKDVFIGADNSCSGNRNVEIGSRIYINGDDNTCVGTDMLVKTSETVIIGSGAEDIDNKGYIGIGYNLFSHYNTIYNIAGQGSGWRYNLEETLTYGYQHKKYIYGIGGYDGTDPNAEGVKSLQEVLADKADASAIPTKVSQLTNDSNFITLNSNPIFSGLTIKSNAKIKFIQKSGDANGTYLVAETVADRVANKVYAADGSLFDVGKLVKKIQCNVSGDVNNIEIGYTTVDNTYNFSVVPTVTTHHGGIMSPADKVKLDSLPSITSKLVNITTASTAEEVVTKFNALLADLKAKGFMKADE